jgi:hypothetical protein
MTRTDYYTKFFFYLKLPNACTIMPRNTAASKTAARPLNTSKDEIVTVLTP